MLTVNDLDEIPKLYASDLDRAADLRALRHVTASYGELAADAAEIAASMTTRELTVWRGALERERSGVFMGPRNLRRFGPLLVPRIMTMVTIIADQDCYPWGFVYNRLKAAGGLSLDDANPCGQFSHMRHVWRDLVVDRRAMVNQTIRDGVIAFASLHGSVEDETMVGARRSKSRYH
jgi:hypothetical protein